MSVRKIIFLLILILLLQMVLRIPFLSEPLERDEGLYGYMAQRILAGEIPYRDAFDHKPPMIYYIYAIILKTCGQSILAIRTATLFYSLLTTIALFILAAYLWGARAGLIAALLAALFLHGPMIQGSNANCETFMILPMILALYCFIKGGREKNFYWMAGSGLLSGLAIMIKQIAAINYLVLIASGTIAGVLMVPMLFLLYYAIHRGIPELINCLVFANLTYASAPVASMVGSLKLGLMTTLLIAWRENSILWVSAVVGIFYILKYERNRGNLLIVIWTLASLLGLVIGKYYFGHYYIQIMPGLILLSSYFIANYVINKASIRDRWIIAIILFIMALPIINEQLKYQYAFSPQQISENKYGHTMWSVSCKIAEDIRGTMQPGDALFVWDSHPEIYFYLNIKAPNHYPYYFPWMGESLERQAIQQVIEQKPKFILWASFVSFDAQLIDYIRKNYRLDRTYIPLNWRLFVRKT